MTFLLCFSVHGDLNPGAAITAKPQLLITIEAVQTVHIVFA